MKYTDSAIKDVKIIETERVGDDRGFFRRLFCVNEFLNIGFDKKLLQINHSFTAKKGTFRGFHFQEPPYTETKIITCIRGKVFDIAIDVRKGSPTFLQCIGIELSDQNGKMIYIPDGFAHGFQTLEENTELIYLHSQIYKPEYEHSINVKDPVLNISLPIEITEISEKDKNILFKNEDFKGIDLNMKPV